MKWVIYYGITTAANTICAIVFREHLNITLMSALPIFFVLLMAFQAGYFFYNRAKADFNVNIDTYLTEEEWGELAVYLSFGYLIFIPTLPPFILFFSDIVKALASLLIFFAAFSAGAVFYRIKHGKRIKARFARESAELDEQRKKEELGKWK